MTNISSAPVASLSLPKTAPVAAGGDIDGDGAGGGAVKQPAPQSSNFSNSAVILSLSPAAQAIVNGTSGA